MDNALVIGGVALVAYLLWKKYGKPCCAGCAGGTTATPKPQRYDYDYGPMGTDAYAAAAPIGLDGGGADGDFTLSTTEGACA